MSPRVQYTQKAPKMIRIMSFKGGVRGIILSIGSPVEAPGSPGGTAPRYAVNKSVNVLLYVYQKQYNASKRVARVTQMEPKRTNASQGTSDGNSCGKGSEKTEQGGHSFWERCSLQVHKKCNPIVIGRLMRKTCGKSMVIGLHIEAKSALTLILSPVG